MRLGQLGVTVSFHLANIEDQENGAVKSVSLKLDFEKNMNHIKI